MHIWGHFKTITKHRLLVMMQCFRVGLIWQGLTHDLSKYSVTEFWQGAKYYQGNKSPNVAEREDKGYSIAWMHHKGRNKHHFEYWTDLKPGTRDYVPVPMPANYLVEMFMDRIAACKTYHGKDYTPADPLNYLNRAHETPLMHPQTLKELRFLLQMLQDRGERDTFRFIREHVRKGEPFPETGGNAMP